MLKSALAIIALTKPVFAFKQMACMSKALRELNFFENTDPARYVLIMQWAKSDVDNAHF